MILIYHMYKNLLYLNINNLGVVSLNVLTVNNLTKTFISRSFFLKKSIDHLIVNNISFNLKKGEILGLLGPNGSGKTTTIQMLLGTLTPSSGSISYFNENFLYDNISALKKIGYASGYERLPARLSIIENLDIVGRIYNMNFEKRTNQIEKLLKFFKIWDLRNSQTGSLSAGQATRVLLAKAFISEPEIVFLDEPTASLDPEIANEIREFILLERKNRNVSILITSHNMQEVTTLCDRIIVLKNGNIIADDTPNSLINSIQKTILMLKIEKNISLVIEYLNNQNYIYFINENNINIEINENCISELLENFSNLKISYSNISINKSTLEDYFLKIAK